MAKLLPRCDTFRFIRPSVPRSETDPLLPFSLFPSGTSGQLVAGVDAAYGGQRIQRITAGVLLPQSCEISLPPCTTLMSARRWLLSAEREACMPLAGVACGAVFARNLPAKSVRPRLDLGPRYA